MTPSDLRAARAKLGLTQAELAELVCVIRAQTISDWERGVDPINPAAARIIDLALHVPEARARLGIIC